MYQTRAHQPQVDVAHSLNGNPYTGFTQPVPEAHQYLQPQSRSPQPPPQQQSNTPITEDGFRPSLPSISNLLGIADGDRPAQDSGKYSLLFKSSVHQRLYLSITASQQAQSQAQQQQTQYPQHATQTVTTSQRQQPAYQSQDIPTSQRTTVPPTPSFRNDSVVEGTHSPSTISTGSSLSNAQPYYVASALNNVEATEQRAAVAASFMKRHSLPSQPNTSPYGASPYTTSPYAHSPGNLSTGSYYSPSDPNYPGHGLYHQRPLPSNLPPQQPMPVQSAPQPPTGNPWEHHHYISPSSQATFPQSQDRYICATCNKAFSRPSSLKIHSHSHSGEKPYKCPHIGCGKAFSVRSNMKRHERGCHTGGAGVLGSSHLG